MPCRLGLKTRVTRIANAFVADCVWGGRPLPNTTATTRRARPEGHFAAPIAGETIEAGEKVSSAAVAAE